MTPQEADILRWMDWQDKPVSDTEIHNQFPRLWSGVTIPLLSGLWVERDKRYYRLTSQGRRALVAFELQGKQIPFLGRKEI